MLRIELVEKYRAMSAEDKIAEARRAIHMDMPPLNLLFAIMLILEPDRVGEIFTRMTLNA